MIRKIFILIKKNVMDAVYVHPPATKVPSAWSMEKPSF